MGSIVRVPLGGRRVRGYVVELADRPPDRLKPIGGVSGDLPVFGPKLRDALIWAAHHYVAPVSVALERAAPPNLPSRPAGKGPTDSHPVSPPAQLSEWSEATSRRHRRPVTALITSWEDTGWIGALGPVLGSGSSAMVVVATAAEVTLLAQRTRSSLGDVVVEVTGDMDDAAITAAWSKVAADPGWVVIGTPRIASWPIADLAAAVVLEEGRRAMKDRQTPTVSVRRLLMTRSRLEGFNQLYVGPTPSVDLLAAGAELVRSGPRAWPLVEVIDRNEEPPGGNLLTDRARAAIRSTVDRGGSVFVFTHRRGYAPAFRCADCHELRRCPTCGSRPEPGTACTRCGTPAGPCSNCGGRSFQPLGAGVGRVLQEARSIFGDRVGEVDDGRPIVVGTERDLASVAGVDVALVVDVDGLALGSNYRAGEEALRILARVAGRVRRGGGHRLIVQTSLPGQPLVTALRRGDPLPLLEHELETRREMGYPPASEILVVEIRGEARDADRELRELLEGEGTLLGPAATPSGQRWLVQGGTLGPVKLGLRPLVQRWRDAGATVRIDVDPLDL